MGGFVLLYGSAAAPISREVLDFFLHFDMLIYGMSGPQTASSPGEHVCNGCAGLQVHWNLPLMVI